MSWRLGYCFKVPQSKGRPLKPYDIAREDRNRIKMLCLQWRIQKRLKGGENYVEGCLPLQCGLPILLLQRCLTLAQS